MAEKNYIYFEVIEGDDTGSEGRTFGDHNEMVAYLDRTYPFMPFIIGWNNPDAFYLRLQVGKTFIEINRIDEGCYTCGTSEDRNDICGACIHDMKRDFMEG